MRAIRDEKLAAIAEAQKENQAVSEGIDGGLGVITPLGILSNQVESVKHESNWDVLVWCRRSIVLPGDGRFRRLDGA